MQQMTLDLRVPLPIAGGIKAVYTRHFPMCRKNESGKQVNQYVPLSRVVEVLWVKGSRAMVGIPTPCGVEKRLADLADLKSFA